MFVSSSIQELEAERTAVREAIERLRLTPVLFEMGARPHRPRDLYRAYITQSHIFVGIYWQSYGWLAAGAKISGLEDEYRMARSLPRLIYIKKPAPQRDARLEALIQEITRYESLSYREFSTPDELRELVENDLAVLLTERFAAAGAPLDGRAAHAAPADERPQTDLPQGTVTLVFTDIEGSTGLLQELGERYQNTLADHHHIIRDAARQFGGREVLTAGDGFFLVFERAPDALQFGLAAQQTLSRHDWPGGLPVLVRMGMHTGEPRLVEGQYVGLCVHRAARISAAAHGGQIVLSSATRELIDTGIPADVNFRDLGMHRLKDLHQWEHLFQVVHADLPQDFPPLRSVDAFPNNLPRKLTSFIGREREIEEIKALLRTAPLLTIVGPGGVGKTRLALQVAADLLTEFQHGAWVVELAPVREPKRVVEAVAAALGVRESPGWSLGAAVLDYVRKRELLLIMDNCEHLIVPVAEFLHDLLTAARGVRVLSTSRETLGMDGEKVWRIPPLPLPDAGEAASLKTLRQNEAVNLFVDRARAVVPEFVLTEQNAAQVTRICVRLDGIPLALELAAARVKVLTVEQIAARLDDRFRLLAGGSRMAVPHHQTLRAAMDWSHDLLSDPERILLRRLAVFSGGWTLEAVEAVCSDPAVDRNEVLDVLTRLIDKSLVDAGGGTEARYTMLETIRQYAHERLTEAEEKAEFQARHGRWFVALAEQAESHLRGPDQKAWLDRLDGEWDNLQAALSWAVDTDESDSAIRLAAALWRFWYLRGHITIADEWLARVLARSQVPAATRAKVLNGTAVLAFTAGNYDQALERARQAIDLARACGDTSVAASARLVLSAACLARGERAEATALAEESLVEFQRAEDPWGEALALSVLGDLTLDSGEYERALRIYDDCVGLFRRVGDAWGIALGERGRGYAVRLLGDYEQAVAVQSASLALATELGDRMGMGSARIQLGFLRWRQGRYDQAKAILEEALAMFRDTGNRRGEADALSVLGLVEDTLGHHTRATEILQESLEIFSALGSRFGVASVHGTLGRVAFHQGDQERGIALAERAVTLFEQIGDRRGAATSLRVLGEAAMSRGDHGQALRYARESYTIFRDLGDRWAIGYALRLLAGIALAQGDTREAYRCYAESLSLHLLHRDRLGIVKCLEGLTGVLIAEEHYEGAAELLGSAEKMRAEIGVPRTSAETPRMTQWASRLQEALGRARCEALMEEGRNRAEDAVPARVREWREHDT